jgi:hypothetical protein
MIGGQVAGVSSPSRQATSNATALASLASIAASTAAQSALDSIVTSAPELHRARTTDSSVVSHSSSTSNKGHPLVVRIGIHSGPVIAGVVGRKCARYHLFGETVTVAEEMEQHGLAGKVVMSEATRQSMLEGMSKEGVKDYELEWIDPLVRAEPSPTRAGAVAGAGVEKVMSSRVLHRYIVRRSRGAGIRSKVQSGLTVSTRRSSVTGMGTTGVNGLVAHQRASITKGNKRIPLDANLQLG